MTHASTRSTSCFHKFPTNSQSILRRCVSCSSPPSVVALTDYTGLHDNGYTTTISQLQTEGLLDKLIFLRGYSQIAYQLRDYGIPECTIPGVFMTQKIPVKQSMRRFAPAFIPSNPPFLQPQPDPSFPQSPSSPPFPQSRSNPSFSQSQSQSNSPFPHSQPSPPFSPPMSTASPFQLMSAPTSPAYLPQSIPPAEPAPYLDPTVVRPLFLCFRADRRISVTLYSHCINRSHLHVTSIT